MFFRNLQNFIKFIAYVRLTTFLIKLVADKEKYGLHIMISVFVSGGTNVPKEWQFCSLFTRSLPAQCVS